MSDVTSLSSSVSALISLFSFSISALISTTDFFFSSGFLFIGISEFWICANGEAIIAPSSIKPLSFAFCLLMAWDKLIISRVSGSIFGYSFLREAFSVWISFSIFGLKTLFWFPFLFIRLARETSALPSCVKSRSKAVISASSIRFVVSVFSLRSNLNKEFAGIEKFAGLSISTCFASWVFGST